MPIEKRNPKLSLIWQQTMVSDIKAGVKLPPGENINDWLAVSIIDFLNQITFLSEPIERVCTHKTCPEMTAGPGYKYAWQDNGKYKKPTMIPAIDYITNVLNWADQLTHDEKVFPSDPSKPYPKDFMQTCKNIFKRLFRIYAHIYHHHLNDMKECSLQDNLNRSFKQFMAFSMEFKLIPEDQLAPLKSLIDQL